MVTSVVVGVESNEIAVTPFPNQSYNGNVLIAMKWTYHSRTLTREGTLRRLAPGKIADVRFSGIRLYERV